MLSHRAISQNDISLTLEKSYNLADCVYILFAYLTNSDGALQSRRENIIDLDCREIKYLLPYDRLGNRNTP